MDLKELLGEAVLAIAAAESVTGKRAALSAELRELVNRVHAKHERDAEREREFAKA